MVIGRAGHSVAELVVAVTFLGAALGAVGASTLLGARWTGEAARRARALEAAAAALDSLTALPEVSDGSGATGGLAVEWHVVGAMIDVRVSDPATGIGLAALEGRRIPEVPLVPLPRPDS